MKKTVALLCLAFWLGMVCRSSDCTESPLGCVARWHFDGDGFESISRNSGHAQGGYRFVSGFMGQCVEFRTSSNGFVISEPPVFQSESFTVEFWIRRLNRTQTSIAGGGAGGLLGGSHWGFSLYLSPEGGLEVANATAIQEFGGPLIRDFAWHHVAVVVDGSSVKTFVDGALTRAANVGRPFAPSPVFLIGSAWARTGFSEKSGFLGNIDEVNVYGRALSQQELGRIFVDGAKPRCEESPSIHWGLARYAARVGDSLELPLVLRDYRATPVGASTIHGEMPAGVELESVSLSAGGACVSRADGFDCELEPMDAGGSVALTVRIRPHAVGQHSIRAGWGLKGATRSEPVSGAETRVLAWPICSSSQEGMSAWWRGESSSMELFTQTLGVERGSVQYTNGFIGQAFWFDGMSSIASPGVSIDPRANVSVEFWMRRGALDRVSTVRGKSATLLSTSAGMQLVLRHDDETLMIDYGPMGRVATGQKIPDLRWHHVSMVRRSGAFHLYVDGGEVETGGFPDVVEVDFAAPFRLGNALGREQAGVGGFYGAMDEFALYDRGLSTKTVKEIVALVNAAKCREDVSIELSPRAATLHVGAESEWMLRVANGGTNAVTGVVATMSMEPSQELVRVTAEQGSCAVKDGELRCEVGELKGETSVLIRPVFRFRNEGIHRPSVRVQRTGDDLFPGNNADSVVCRVLGACAPEPGGLVGRWTGNGHSRDIVGNVTASHETGQYGPGLGGSGLAFELNGTGGIRAREQGGEHPVEFTWSGWVRPMRVGRAWSTLVYWEGVKQYAPRLHLAILANEVERDGAARLALRTDLPGFPTPLMAGWQDWADGGESLPLGEWSHVAVTCDAKGLMSVFVNGQCARQIQAGSRVVTRAGQLDFGRTPEKWLAEEEGAHFEGSLSEVKLFGRALNAEEIQWQASRDTVHPCLPKVSLRLVHPPEVVKVGGTVRATLSLSNEVDAVIGKCQVRLQSSAGLKWRSATLAGGDCRVLGGEILCELPSLGAGAEAELNLTCEVLDPTNGKELSATLAVVDGSPLDNPMVLRIPIDVDRPCGLIPGVVGYWGFDGILTGGASGMALDGAEGFEFVGGRAGRAIRFDGRSGLSVRSPQPMFLQELSIECWYRRETLLATASSREFGTIIGSEKGGWNFSMTPEGALSFGRAGFGRVDTWPAVRDLEWHHLAVTKRDGVVKFYMDGVGIGAYAFDVQFDFGSGIAVGGLAGNPRNRLIGTLDELVVYDRALEDSEVRRAYTHWGRNGCANDLELHAELSRSSVDSGHVFEWKWVVSNRGGSRAERFSIHAKLPPDIVVDSVSNLGSECRVADGELQCEVNGLDAGSTSTVRWILRALGPSRILHLDSEIQGAPHDLVTANSRASQHLLIRGDCVDLPTGVVAWWNGDAGNSVQSEWMGNFPSFESGSSLAPGRRRGTGIVGAGIGLFHGVDVGRLETRLRGAVGSNGLTISCWMKLTAKDPGPRMLVGVLDQVSHQSVIELGIRPWSADTGGSRYEPVFALPDSGGLSLPEGHWVGSGIGLDMEDWNHWVLVCDPEQRLATMYVNGVEVRRIRMRPGACTIDDASFFIENGGGFYGSALRATADEAMVFDRALDADEVATLSNAGSAGGCRSDVQLTMEAPDLLGGYPGFPFTVKLKAKNHGDRPMTGLVLTNEVPEFLEIRALSPSLPDVRSEVVDHQVRTRIGTLAPGASIDFALEVQGLTPSMGVWVATLGGEQAEVSLSNNQVIRSLAIEPVLLAVQGASRAISARASDGIVEAIVTVSPVPRSAIEVDFWTEDGTAKADSDYVATQGRLIIPAGVTNSVIRVPLIDDGFDDVKKRFSIHLGFPKNAELAVDRVDVTIATFIGEVAVTVDDPSAMEGKALDGTIDFHVRLASPLVRPVTVGYRTVSFTAQENLDFEPTSGQVVFQPGETEKIIRVRLIDDALAEPLETFGLSVGTWRVPGDKRLGIATIRDDDSSPVEGIRGFEWEMLSVPEVPEGLFRARIRAVDSSGKTVSHFSGPVRMGAYSGSGVSSSLVLTEFANPQQPTVEIQNVGVGPSDASGWRLLFYAGLTPVAPIGSIAISIGTNLESGAVFVVSTNGFGAPVSGIVLQDPTGQVRDCLFLDDATSRSVEEPRRLSDADWAGGTPRRPYGDYSLSRVGDSREGNASAWTWLPRSVGFPNVGLWVPFIDSQDRGVEPGRIAEWKDGSYTGTFRLLTPASQIRLVAEDAEGHRGVSAVHEFGRLTTGADIVLGLQAEPLHKQFEVFHFEATVTNLGPEAVGPLLLTVPFPIEWRVRNFEASGNTHGGRPSLSQTNGQMVVSATVDGLGMNQVARIQFGIVIPGIPLAQIVPIHGSISVPDSDPNPRNNRAKALVEIATGPAGPFNNRYRPNSWWPATEGARDLVRGVEGVLSGGARVGEGRIGPGFHFDGGTSALVLPHAPMFNLGPNQEMEIEFWLRTKPYDTREQIHVLSKRDPISGAGYRVFLDHGVPKVLLDTGIPKNVPLQERVTYSGDPVQLPSMDVRDGRWHHIGVETVRPWQHSVYIDGYPYGVVGLNSPAMDFSNAADVVVGADRVHPEQSFDGDLDELIFVSPRKSLISNGGLAGGFGRVIARLDTRLDLASPVSLKRTTTSVSAELPPGVVGQRYRIPVFITNSALFSSGAFAVRLQLDPPAEWVRLVPEGHGSGVMGTNGVAEVRLDSLSVDEEVFMPLEFISQNVTQRVSMIVTSPVPNVLVDVPWLLTVNLSPDSDGDGMDDAWEQANGLDPKDPSDALLDLDEDGLTNMTEYQLGTLPRDPESSFQVGMIFGDFGGVDIQWQSVPGRRYQVVRRDESLADRWTVVAEVTATTETTYATDYDAPATGRFYAVRMIR